MIMDVKHNNYEKSESNKIYVRAKKRYAKVSKDELCKAYQIVIDDVAIRASSMFSAVTTGDAKDKLWAMVMGSALEEALLWLEEIGVPDDVTHRAVLDENSSSL